MTTNIHNPTELLIFRQDDPNHPLNHTREKRTSLKRTLPPDKFEQPMRLAYTDGMPPSLNDDDDDDSGNAVHKKGMNEILIAFFGDGNNDDNDDHMVDSNDDSMGNYHNCNVDDNNLKDLIKQLAKTPVFKSSTSRTSKLAYTLILL